MDLGIAGKTAFVSGASRGIGRACVIALAAEGVRVAVTGRSADEVRALVDRVGGEAAGHVAVPGDLLAEDGPAKIATATIEHFGGVDIVVHNLGGTLAVRDSFAPLAQWRAVWRANLEVAIELNERFVPGMRERRWGRIVAISSLAGSEHQGALPYATAKAALNAYVRGLARELIAEGISVTAVAPGTVVTEGGVWDERQRRDPVGTAAYVAERLPAGRFSSAESIADAVAFLCSARSLDCSGVVMAVDAGAGRAFGLPR